MKKYEELQRICKDFGLIPGTAREMEKRAKDFYKECLRRYSLFGIAQFVITLRGVRSAIDFMGDHGLIVSECDFEGMEYKPDLANKVIERYKSSIYHNACLMYQSLSYL